MSEPRHQFTNVSRLTAEAFGEPGSRTFCISVDSESSAATIWIEKEQLLQLALAIQNLLASVEEDEDEEFVIPPGVHEADSLTNLDFKAVKLGFGHDNRYSLFILEVYDLRDSDHDDATLRIYADREQIKDFSQDALVVCASGRPLCPLCGRPIDRDGHRCARVNGRTTLTPEDLKSSD